ncbi:MAG: hypothetical protein WD040_04960 [Anaerolineales bacterium]
MKGSRQSRLPRTVMVAGLALSAAGLACSVLGLGGSSGDYADAFDSPANPLASAPELDSSHASSAVMSASGGTIEATGADGTHYTLSIPEGALALEHEITLTPVRAVADLPLNGLGGSVALEPAGLHFFEFATLTIAPAVEIPVGEQVTFAFEVAGGDFHFQPLALDPDAIQIFVLGSGTFGVGRADRSALLERLPTSPGDRFFHHLGDIFLRGREAGSDAGMEPELKSLFTSFYASVLERIEATAAAGSGTTTTPDGLQMASIEVGRPLAATASSCEEARQLFDLGLSEKLSVELGITEGAGLDTPSDALALKLAEACLDEAHEACVADHNLARLPEEYLGLWYLGELGLVSDGAVAQITTLASGLMEKCYQFDLEFISIVTVKEEGIGGFESIMTSSVPLRLVNLDLPNDAAFNELEVAGMAPLTNESITFEVEPGGCTITGVPGGADIEVLKLPLVLSGTGLADVNLTYLTGASTEGGITQCPQAETSDLPQGGYWSNSYFALHFDELSMAQGPGAITSPGGISGGIPIPYIASDWEIVGGDEVARKDYVRSQDQLSEDTTFVLIHSPQ